MEPDPARKIGFITSAALVIILGFTIIFGSWYTVDQGERAVVLRNGAVVSSADAGLHFKVPLIEDVRRFEVRTMKLRFEKIAIYSKDIQAAEIQIEVNFRPDAAKITEIYSTLGMNYAERVLWPNLLRETKEVFGKYVASDIINQRDKLGTDITANVARSLASYNIVVESVQVVNVDFSDVFENSIEARMKAEVEVQQQRQILEKQKVQADTVRVNADADAYRVRQEAAANADKVKQQSEAEAYRIKLTTTAEAEGISKRGAALRDNPSLIDLVKSERWDGKLPTTMVPGSATPFINVGSR